MKTSALSPLTGNASGTAPTRQADAAPDVPFSQMLSREMAAKPKASEPPKAPGAQNDKEAQAARPQSGDTNTDAPQQAGASAGPDATAEGGARRAVDDDAPKTSDATEQEDDPASSAASDELLALVASLAQPASKVAAQDAASTDDSQQTSFDAPDGQKKTKGQPQELALATQAATAPAMNGLAGPESVPAAAASSAKAGSDAGAIRLNEPAAGAARRNIAVNSDSKPRVADKNEEIPSDAAPFDAKLEQARDDKSTTATGKAEPGSAELDAIHSSERATAKPVHAIQQPTAAQINTTALPAAAPIQPPPAMVAQVTEMLAPRVGSQGWDQALGQKVVWMVGSDVQSASLTLNPPDLGPLQVVLQVSDNQATANFTAAQPEVRHALEAAMPKLREMLGDAGIQLGQANVSAGNPNSGQQNAFGQPQQSAPRHGQAAGDSADAPVTRTSRSQTIVSGRGLVDTFV